MVDRIDLNTAERETLATLPGIGEALAERIVAFREEVHPFEEVIELAAVSGISERMVRNVEDRVTVGAPPDSEEDALPSAPSEEPPISEESEAAAPEEAPGEKEPVTEAPEVAAEEEATEPQAVATARAVEATERASDAREDARPSRRGVGCTLLGVLAGAIAGAALTLFFLFLLNGTLLFGGRQRLTDLEQEVLMEARDQEAVDAELAEASAELATVAAARETVAAAQASTAAEVEELAADLDDLESNVMPAMATLESQTAAQATRLSGIAAAAGNFDAFLTNMRDLLIELQGLPPTPTGTPTATLSPSTPTGTGTPTLTPSAGDETQTVTPDGSTPTPTWTPAATRTPRPTATPIIQTTGTPTD